ncbi:MAG: GNAT family N-acetyltransferase [Roseobacter sp.]
MTNDLSLVPFDHLAHAQMRLLHGLDIPDKQREFGGSFAATLQKYLSSSCSTHNGLCILKDMEPIGMVVLKRPPSSPDWVPEDAASLHELKIDQNWQGQGLGKHVLLLTLDQVVTIWPGVRQLVLAVDSGNSAALALYRGFGMDDSGPVHLGRLGYEHRMTKKLG